ncbi:MAG: DUF1634 domain-containing protein [Thermomicrobiales bacterium]|nr:DUF1634 domain-containing protein [Thermomicrobiales bacterium]
MSARQAAPGVADAQQQEIAELAARTERLTPLYEAAGRVFAWGFRIGAAILAIGILVAVVKGEPLAHQADRITNVPARVLAGDSAGIIDLAILWFMGVPVVTVIVAAVDFWRLGDRRYALLTLVVLIILGVSIALALNR